MARNFHSSAKWVPGTVIAQRGPVSYLVEVQGRRMWRRHVDHLREFQPTATEVTFSRSQTVTASGLHCHTATMPNFLLTLPVMNFIKKATQLVLQHNTVNP